LRSRVFLPSVKALSLMPAGFSSAREGNNPLCPLLVYTVEEYHSFEQAVPSLLIPLFALPPTLSGHQNFSSEGRPPAWGRYVKLTPDDEYLPPHYYQVIAPWSPLLQSWSYHTPEISEVGSMFSFPG